MTILQLIIGRKYSPTWHSKKSSTEVRQEHKKHYNRRLQYNMTKIPFTPYVHEGISIILLTSNSWSLWTSIEYIVAPHTQLLKAWAVESWVYTCRFNLVSSTDPGCNIVMVYIPFSYLLYTMKALLCRTLGAVVAAFNRCLVALGPIFLLPYCVW